MQHAFPQAALQGAARCRAATGAPGPFECCQLEQRKQEPQRGGVLTADWLAWQLDGSKEAQKGKERSPAGTHQVVPQLVQEGVGVSAGIRAVAHHVTALHPRHASAGGARVRGARGQSTGSKHIKRISTDHLTHSDAARIALAAPSRQGTDLASTEGSAGGGGNAGGEAPVGAAHGGYAVERARIARGEQYDPVAVPAMVARGRVCREWVV